MSKLILEFSMPEEKDDFEMANKGVDAHSCLSEITNDIFRSIRKYGGTRWEGSGQSELTNLIHCIDNLVENIDNSSWPKDEYQQKLNATSLVGLLETLIWKIIDSYELKI